MSSLCFEATSDLFLLTKSLRFLLLLSIRKIIFCAFVLYIVRFSTRGNFGIFSDCPNDYVHVINGSQCLNRTLSTTCT